MGRLSNSPPPKSAQQQSKDSEPACEWHGWATVEIGAGGRKSAIFPDGRLGLEWRKDALIDRADEKRDTLLMCGELRPVQAGKGPEPARIGLVWIKKSTAVSSGWTCSGWCSCWAWRSCP